MGSRKFPQSVVRFIGTNSVVESNESRPLAFVHINKTAGTSFTRYLIDHFAGRDVVAPPFYGDFEQIGISNRTTELFWGHFTFAQFVAQRPKAWFITFLREPVQRVISQYRSLHNPKNLQGNWEQVLPKHALDAMKFAHRASFEEFVCSDDPFIVGHIRDLQTLFLSSERDYRHPHFLSSAMTNIEKRFLFVGTTERFDESIDLFRYQFQSQHAFLADSHHRNVSQRYPVSMSGRAMDRVMELVANDLELYQFAADLVDGRLAALRASNGITTTRRAA